MRGLKSTISQYLPETVKAIIRPYYHSVRRPFLKQRSADRPAMLAIDSFGEFRVAYRKGSADERQLRQSFDHDQLFSGVPEYRLDDRDVIIDIGAHIGTFALLASSRARSGKVYAVEACEDSFTLLRINAALNGSDNIVPCHLALGDRDGTCTLYHDLGTWGHSIVKRPTRSSEQVEACTLATFFERYAITACQFMKLNCEGSEFPILLGAPDEVLGRIQCILVLFHGDLWRANTEDELVRRLESGGFNCAFRNVSEYGREGRVGRRGWIVATR